MDLEIEKGCHFAGLQSATLFLSSKDCEKKLTINLKINVQPKNINELERIFWNLTKHLNGDILLNESSTLTRRVLELQGYKEAFYAKCT